MFDAHIEFLCKRMGSVFSSLSRVSFLFFDLFFFFFFCRVFLHEHSLFTEQQGKAEAISLTPLYHFHPLHRHLDISRVISAVISAVYPSLSLPSMSVCSWNKKHGIIDVWIAHRLIVNCWVVYREIALLKNYWLKMKTNTLEICHFYKYVKS